jgi:hypothetical protein
MKRQPTNNEHQRAAGLIPADPKIQCPQNHSRSAPRAVPANHGQAIPINATYGIRDRQLISRFRPFRRQSRIGASSVASEQPQLATPCNVDVACKLRELRVFFPGIECVAIETRSIQQIVYKFIDLASICGSPRRAAGLIPAGRRRKINGRQRRAPRECPEPTVLLPVPDRKSGVASGG